MKNSVRSSMKTLSWTIISAIISRGIAMVSTAIVANIVTINVVGAISLVRITVNTFTNILNYSVSSTATRLITIYENQDKSVRNSIVSTILFFGIISSITISSIFWMLSTNSKIFETKLSYETNLVIAITISLGILNGTLSGILVGSGRYDLNAKIALIGSLFLVFLPLLAVWKSELGAAWCFLIINFLVLMMQIYSQKRDLFHIRTYTKIEKRFLTETLNFSSPTLFGGVCVAITYWYIPLVLTNSMGLGEVAIYDISTQWRMLALFVSSAVGPIILKEYTNSIAESGVLNIKTFLKFALSNFIITALACSLILCLSVFFSLIYGNLGVSVASIMPGVLLSTLAQSVASTSGAAVLAQGRAWLGFFINILWSISVVIMTQLFIKGGFGVLSPFNALTCTYLLVAAFQMLVVLKGAPKQWAKSKQSS